MSTWVQLLSTKYACSMEGTTAAAEAPVSVDKMVCQASTGVALCAGCSGV
jgi:hypothetical protein